MRVTRTLVGISVVLGVIVAGLPGSSAGQRTTRDAAPRFYVALGDSVAAGFQPDRGITDHGYVDDLWRSVRRTQIPNLTSATSPVRARRASSLRAQQNGSRATRRVDRNSTKPSTSSIAMTGGSRSSRSISAPTIWSTDAWTSDALRFSRVCVVDLTPPVRSEDGAHRRRAARRARAGRADRGHELLQPVPRGVGTGARRPPVGARRTAVMDRVQRRARDRVRPRGRAAGRRRAGLQDRRLPPHGRAQRIRRGARQRGHRLPAHVGPVRRRSRATRIRTGPATSDRPEPPPSVGRW